MNRGRQGMEADDGQRIQGFGWVGLAGLRFEESTSDQNRLGLRVSKPTPTELPGKTIQNGSRLTRSGR